MRQTTRDHRRQLETILASQRELARPFADTSPEARDRRKALPFFAWAQTYLPHYFTCQPWSKHIEAEALSGEEGMPQFHCWSRGAGKSVIFSLAKPLHWILSQTRHFIIFGGATEDVAIDKADFIGLELTENQRLRADYGDDACTVEGEEGARVMGDTLLWCRGIGQSTRGQRHRQYRPDAFVGDDLENDGLARNPAREDALWDWLLGATFPGLESHGARAIFIIVGTMYGRKCMMERARTESTKTDATGRPLCRYFCYPLLDEHGHSTWPDRYSDDDLARACAIMGASIARREVGCKADDEEASFRSEWIREFDSRTLDRSGLRVAGFLDPSATHTERSDYKALIVLATPADAKPGQPQPIFCLHAWIRRASPMEMIDHLFWVVNTYSPGLLACESNGFQNLIWPLLSGEQRRRGQIFSLRSITNTTNKQDRILCNQGEFERGLCLFDPQEGDQRILIDQFLDFGKTSVHDDGPDAWDGARRMLPGGTSGEPFYYRGFGRSGGRPSDLLGSVDEDIMRNRPDPRADVRALSSPFAM